MGLASVKRTSKRDAVLKALGRLLNASAKEGELAARYGAREDDALRLAAGAEARSEHPLGAAIVAGAVARGLDLPPAAEVRATSMSPCRLSCMMPTTPIGAIISGDGYCRPNSSIDRSRSSTPRSILGTMPMRSSASTFFRAGRPSSSMRLNSISMPTLAGSASKRDSRSMRAKTSRLRRTFSR